MGGEQQVEAKVATNETLSKMVEVEVQGASPKHNNYAFACAMLASMASILLGYGMLFLFFSLSF